MMQFNYPKNYNPDTYTPVEIGNVYGSKNTHKTVAWVVMAISGNTAHLLGLDAEGRISSTQSYNVHSFTIRKVIGVVDFSKLEFDIAGTE